MADQRQPVLQTHVLSGELYEAGIGTTAVFSPGPFVGKINHNLSSLSSSCLELTSLFLTGKCVTVKVFSSLPFSREIRLSEFL